MTISSENRKAGPYTGNGVTASFPFSFKVFAASDLLVVRTDLSSVDSTLTLTTDYTVSLNADQNANPGGTVTLTVGALTSGYKLTIASQVAYTQATDLTNQGGFYPSVITNALDKLTILIQQLKESVGRTLKVSISTPAGVSTELPPPASSQVIGWNADGTALQNFDATVLASSVQFANWQYDTFTGNGSTVNFSLTGNPVTAANMDVSIGGVTQVPGTDFTVLSNVLTFVTAPPNGVNILARYGQAAQQVVLGLSQERQTATAGQTVFTLGTSYVPGAGGLAVYMNGSRLTPVDDYIETNSTTVTLTAGATVGDQMLFTIGNPVNNAVAASTVGYTPASGSAVDLQTRLRAYEASGGSSLLGFIQAGVSAVIRYIQDKLREGVSVKDFGAKGDADPITGSGTDDSAAIQAALYSRGSTGDRQLSVFCPDGTYYSSTDLIIPEGVCIYGNGAWRAKIHFASGKGFRMVSGGTYDFPPEIYGLSIYSSGAVAVLRIESISGASVHDNWFGGTTGIEIQGTADIAIHDNVFDKTSNGVVFTAGTLCNNISIQDNSFTGNAYAITLKNARDVRITGNAFRGDANHNIHILSQNASNTLIGVVISGNTFYTAPGVGAAGSLIFKINGTLSNVMIVGNTLDGSLGQGIYVDSGAVNGVLIASNIFNNIGSDAISFINTGSQVSVKDNIFRTGITGKVMNYNVAGVCTFINNEVYSANAGLTAGINGAAVDVQQATHFVARGNTMVNTTMTYGFSIRSTVVSENAHDNVISGATVAEYNIANSTQAAVKLTGPLNPGTLGAGSQANGIWAGSGVPSNAWGSNGDWFMRTDTPGTANQRLYVKNAGAWSGII